jgi:hypothetical protein
VDIQRAGVAVYPDAAFVAGERVVEDVNVRVVVGAGGREDADGVVRRPGDRAAGDGRAVGVEEVQPPAVVRS